MPYQLSSLEDIMQLSLPGPTGKGGLTFLSACQTAQGDGMPSESVHLAAGMLFAGYGGAPECHLDDVVDNQSLFG
jgi:hypothetical protein